MEWLQIVGIIAGALIGILGIKDIIQTIGAYSSVIGNKLTALAKRCEDGDLTAEEIIETLKDAKNLPDAIKKAKRK